MGFNSGFKGLTSWVFTHFWRWILLRAELGTWSKKSQTIKHGQKFLSPRHGYIHAIQSYYIAFTCLFFKTLILLMWRIWWAPNNASKWQMGFNSAFKVLICDLQNSLPCTLFTNSCLSTWHFLHASKASCQPFPILVVLLTPVPSPLQPNLNLYPTVRLCFSFCDTDSYIWTISHILLHWKHYLELSGRERKQCNKPSADIF